jgi:elongation of very long chain fatty acids protein 4
MFALIAYDTGMTVWGNRVDKSRTGYRLGFIMYTHYNNKFVELLDTVFMVLRKKNDQISFLHVYHHFLIMWVWFVVCKFACGGDAYFGAILNSFVHVIMYGYYLMALLKIRCPWKQQITNIQMLQFVLCFSQSIYCLYNGNYPRTISLISTFVQVNMLVLFGNFYKKSYLNGNSDKKKSNATATVTATDANAKKSE